MTVSPEDADKVFALLSTLADDPAQYKTILDELRKTAREAKETLDAAQAAQTKADAEKSETYELVRKVKRHDEYCQKKAGELAELETSLAKRVADLEYREQRLSLGLKQFEEDHFAAEAASSLRGDALKKREDAVSSREVKCAAEAEKLTRLRVALEKKRQILSEPLE